jgi:hypothetical protein
MAVNEKGDTLSILSKENVVGVKIVSCDDDELAEAEKHIAGESEYTPEEYKKLVKKIDL